MLSSLVEKKPKAPEPTARIIIELAKNGWTVEAVQPRPAIREPRVICPTEADVLRVIGELL